MFKKYKEMLNYKYNILKTTNNIILPRTVEIIDKLENIVEQFNTVNNLSNTDEFMNFMENINKITSMENYDEKILNEILK